MPRTPQQNAESRAAQEANIKAAAARVFARRGFAATRVADIAAEAGVSQGLMHHYFAGKDALFAALVEEIMRDARAFAVQARAQPGTPLERLRWFVRVALEGARHRPEAFLLPWQAHAGGDSVPDAVRTALARGGRAASRAVARLIADAQDAGEAVDGDPAQLAAHVSAFLQGLALAMTFEHPSARADPELVLRVVAPKRGRR